MKNIFKLILICTYCCALGPIYAGTEINNGGAGISIKGKVATFYSAEMQVNPTPLKMIPTISFLMGLIKRLDLPNNVKLELYENILPSFNRIYYDVDQDHIDEETLNIIKKEYSRITKLPVESITIFALTDPLKKITLLLPDFYKLNENEQASILLHESLWINKRVKSYEIMLEIERDMQIYAMYPNDCTPRYNLTNKFASIFGDTSWSLNSIFNCQTDKYRLYTNAASVPVSDFFTSSELEILGQIMIDSIYMRPANSELHDLLLKEVEEPGNFNFFQESKRALVKGLKENELKVTITSGGRPYQLAPSLVPTKQGLEYLIETMGRYQIYYGFLNYNFFELNFHDPSSLVNIKMTLAKKETQTTKLK